MVKTEIEQKFLFLYLPYDKLTFHQKTTVYRKYLSINPEIRINRRVFEKEERYHLTIKHGTFLKRNEIKLRLSREEYEALFYSINKPPLIMDVYEFFYDEEHIMSFKICKNVNISFAEMEYKDEDDLLSLSSCVQSQPFIGENITWDSTYYSKNIWQYICANQSVDT